MHWYQDEEEEEADLMFSPALLARRASESWIDSAPIEVHWSSLFRSIPTKCLTLKFYSSYPLVEHPSECDASAQKVIAGRAADPGEQHDESGGGVGARIGSSRRGSTSKGRVGAIQGESTAVSGQSTSEGKSTYSPGHSSFYLLITL